MTTREELVSAKQLTEKELDLYFQAYFQFVQSKDLEGRSYVNQVFGQDFWQFAISSLISDPTMFQESDFEWVDNTKVQVIADNWYLSGLKKVRASLFQGTNITSLIEFGARNNKSCE